MSDAVVATSGFRLQRHEDAMYTATKHFSDDKKQKATLKNGLNVEYVVHSLEVPNATEEERVVLIMGFRQAKESWAMIVDQLLTSWSSPKSLKIVTFDNRGVGNTDSTWGRYTSSQMAGDTLELMDHLGWNEAHVAGISMGGMISLELASAAPKRVKSLTLIVTTRGKYVNDHGDGEMRKSLLATDPQVIVAAIVSMLYPDTFVSKKMQDKDEIIRDVLTKYHASRLAVAPKPSKRGVFGQVLACRTHFVSDERLAEIGEAGFPVLIMGGGDDHVIPGRESTLLAEHIKGDHVKYIMFEEGGHGLFTQYIDEVIENMITTMQRASL